MPDGSAFDETAYTRTRTRQPTLGRMSVFVIGVLLGVALGAAGAIFAWPSVSALIPQDAPPVIAKPAIKAAVVTPPPSQVVHVVPGRPVVIGVFGDSLGDGIWAGLYRQLKDDKTYQVVRESRAATGLTNYQYVNVHDVAVDQLAAKPIDIAVMMIGANDEQGIAAEGHVYPFGTPDWRRVYEQRIDDMVALFRAHGAAVYWVGLPKMRRVAYDARAQFLNTIYEERARALGVSFIPTVPVTVNAHGDYDDYLADAGGGRPRLMRAEDGIHMTMAGYLRLAAPAMGLIRTDVTRALAAAAATQNAAPVSQVAEGAAPGAGSDAGAATAVR